MTDIRTATWTNIGYDIKKAKTVEEALKLSHLDHWRGLLLRVQSLRVLPPEAGHGTLR